MEERSDNDIVGNEALITPGNSVPEATCYMEPNIFNVDEKDGDSDIQEEDYEGKENYEGFNGTGRTVTLQMLMSANVLQPGKSLMTIEYLGQKFVGDLLPDGKIKSQETETIFLTPSAWAMHCKRIINPEKKSGCGWASVKYKGKKLDVYKNSWLRKCALQKDAPLDDYEIDAEKKSFSPLPVVKRTVYPFSTISNRNTIHDANTLVEAVSFSSVGKMQPFLITINSSALLMADFHCHLTNREVCGYLGGHWDINTHTLQITKAYPCCNNRFDRQKASSVEHEIQKLIIRDQLLLVGWYHSHPKFQAEPTLRDCDSQLNYQIRMRGESETTYTPCVSIIISPFFSGNPTLESVIKAIWIMPSSESKQALEYGRPMLMQYTMLQDKELPEEMRNEIQTCVDYYSQFRNELINFNNIFYEDITYIEKLKNTLYLKFPFKQNDKTLWNWICAVLGCEQEDNFMPPKTIKIIDNTADANPIEAFIKSPESDLTMKETKDELNYKSFPNLDDFEQKTAEQFQVDQKASELKILSLQEQLCLPSGLNMNPVRMLSPLAAPNPIGIPNVAPQIVSTTSNPTPINSTTASAVSSELLPPLPQIVPFTTNIMPISSNSTTLSGSAQLPAVSPRDSPITIPSSSASPAKFEIPVRASPSPAKSDTSSHTSRTRNSPTPSPGKFSISDIARNSPSITPNKYDIPSASMSSTSACLSTANDLVAASLAQLAGQLAPNFFQSEIATIFQNQRKDYGSSSLNQLAVAAAKVGNQKISQSVVSANDIPETPVPSFSNNFNLPSIQDTVAQTQAAMLMGNKNKSDRSAKLASSFSSNTSNSYKTKLMKELDDLKNDPLKMSEMMRSPEYAALLLQQAEALGATTLGTLGFGADFSYLTGTSLTLPSNNGSNNSNCAMKTKITPTSTPSLPADYNNLIQASKLLGYDSYIQQVKSNDLNLFLQQQISAAAAASVPPSTSSGSSKKQVSQPHPDYSTLLQTYTKLFDTNNQFGNIARGGKISTNAHHELSALLAPGGAGSTSGGSSTSGNSKQKPKDIVSQIQQHSEMLNQLLQTENALLYHQNKPADLNTLFAPPTSMNSSFKPIGTTSSSVTTVSSHNDPGCFVSGQDKVPDYASFFQSPGKYDNNAFISPSTLLKIQQESLSAMMMKPPKTSSTGLGNRTRESSSSPALERLTPVKSAIGNSNTSTNTNQKYNFSAVDLAISSVPSEPSSPATSENNINAMTHQVPSNTPPVDFSRLYGELAGTTKKRMEFSSVAELAAPPPAKVAKASEEILNLSSQ